jgi:hypothetical protein
LRAAPRVVDCSPSRYIKSIRVIISLPFQNSCIEKRVFSRIP